MNSARDADISERTLKRAKQTLGVESRKESDGSWTWKLPEHRTRASTAGPLALLAPLTPSHEQPLEAGAKGAKRRPLGPLKTARIPRPAEEGQGCQGGQEAACIHDYPGGRVATCATPNTR
jgi:hypothetical protein